MRKLFKWVTRLFLLALALAAILVLFRNPLLRIIAEQQIQKETGMQAILGQVRFDLKSPVVRLENIRLINPPEFGGRLFIDLPEVRLEYDSVALLFRRIRFHRIDFRLDEIRVVRDAHGRTNVDLFRQHLARSRLPSQLTEWNWQFEGIEHVIFAVGRLNYRDAREPQKNEEVFAGVRNAKLRPLRSGEQILGALARIAESRGALWTAEALAPGSAIPAGSVQLQ